MSPPASRSTLAPLVVIAAATLLTSALTYAAPGEREPLRAPSPATVPAPIASAPLAAGFAPLAAASPPNANADDQLRLSRTIRFLQDQQNLDGGFPGRPGDVSDPGFSAWVGLALAAGGINPQDQRGEGGASAYDYIAAHAGELKDTTDFERVLMVAIAAGADPRNFGGRDLVTTIVERQLSDGSFPYEAGGKRGVLNATSFAVISLSVIDDPAVKPVLDRACDWLQANQASDGSWANGNADLTASAIEALRAAGRDDTAQEREAWNYLRSNAFVERDGGFNEANGDPESNSASTAWAVQGMWAAGLEPRDWATAPPGPLELLASLQNPETGMIRWKASIDMNPVWMTAYAAPAFAGYPLPIPAVARAAKVGDAPTAEGGVTSGGGGQGAPNFSRPEPQSQGETTGGVRQIKNRQSDQGSTMSRDRTNDEQERTTSASNGSGDAGVTRDVAAPEKANGPGAIAGAQTEAAAGTGGGPGNVATGTQVTGMVVNAARGGADGSALLATEAVAPGLISASERRAGALAAGIGSALLLVMLMGMKIERDQLAERLP